MLSRIHQSSTFFHHFLYYFFTFPSSFSFFCPSPPIFPPHSLILYHLPLFPTMFSHFLTIFFYFPHDLPSPHFSATFWHFSGTLPHLFTIVTTIVSTIVPHFYYLPLPPTISSTFLPPSPIFPPFCDFFSSPFSHNHASFYLLTSPDFSRKEEVFVHLSTIFCSTFPPFPKLEKCLNMYKILSKYVERPFLNDGGINIQTDRQTNMLKRYSDFKIEVLFIQSTPLRIRISENIIKY